MQTSVFFLSLSVSVLKSMVKMSLHKLLIPFSILCTETSEVDIFGPVRAFF